MSASRAVLIPLMLAAALAVGGCGGDTTAISAGSTATTTSTSPTSSPTPSIKPATGVVMDNGYLTARAPKGWVIGESSFTNAVNALNQGATQPAGGIVSMLGASEKGLERTSIQAQAKWALQVNRDYVRKIVGYPRFNGRDWYELTGFNEFHQRIDLYGRDEFGTMPYTVYFRFTYPATFPAAERKRIEESVLATATFLK
ncbi:hypothetical protein AB3X52_01625 [Nocardioides sp. DS6]|uniref:DUF1795 domain-containing protein n=1 Tax=Nocardioides eburneus TaxID=3231482 RepID=A0ABV3STQ6_9ACTN